NMGLLLGQTMVVMERFDARRACELIQEHRVQFVLVVPTMMRRILELPDLRGFDLSSLESTIHTAAICPPVVKRGWIDLLGPEKVWEAFGATEAVGHHVIRGDEWLQHPGSVGRPWQCEQKILGEDGRELPPGEIGEIFTRP